MVDGLRRKRDLGFDHRFADGWHGFAVARDIEAQVAANVVERDRDQQVVDVVAAQVRVAVGGDDFEDSVMQLEDRDVEGAAAQVVDGDDAVLLLVESVGQGSGGRLIDQAEDFEAGDAARVFRGLALGVVEIGGHGDDRLRHRRTEESLGVALELAQDERGNLRRSESLVAQPDAQHFAGCKIVRQAEGEQLQFFLDVFNAASHQALDRVDGALGSFDQIFAGGVADDDLICFRRAPPPRHQVQAVLARNHDRACPPA